MMRPLRRLLCAVLCAASLPGFVSAAAASPAKPQAGVEYLALPAPQPVTSGDKVEVTEFFAYYCPHCYAFEPVLAAWVRKQGANIVFKRVHIASDASVQPQQRLFYTLDTLGLVDQYHDKVFAAMHANRLPLASDEQVLDWAAKAGIGSARFIDTYGSYGVQARMYQAGVQMAAYGIQHWPMVAIDGRYVTSLSLAHAGSKEDAPEAQRQQEALQVMDFLVAKAKAEKQ